MRAWWYWSRRLVDAALTQKVGMAMGPLAVGDLAGLEIGQATRKARGLHDPKAHFIDLLNACAGRRLEPPPGTSRCAAAAERPRLTRGRALSSRDSKGRIGQKSGSGWYRYDKTVGGGRVPLPDPELGVLLREHRARMPICGSNPGLLTLGMCMYAHRSPPPEVGRYA